MGWYDVPRPIIPDLIAQHGRNQAGKPALLEGARRLDWAEFDAATNQVANGLLQLGLAPGARLAVLMSNSIEMALVLFGAGKAGISVVPLNMAVTDAAVAAMIRDSERRPRSRPRANIACASTHCVARGEIARDLARARGRSASGAGWVDFDAWLAAQPETPPRVTVAPETECNIIYSSGTTGLPKGIVHTHGCRMLWADGPRDRVALSQRRGHGLLAGAVLEHQLGRDALHRSWRAARS